MYFLGGLHDVINQETDIFYEEYICTERVSACLDRVKQDIDALDVKTRNMNCIPVFSTIVPPSAMTPVELVPPRTSYLANLDQKREILLILIISRR